MFLVRGLPHARHLLWTFRSKNVKFNHDSNIDNKGAILLNQ